MLRETIGKSLKWLKTQQGPSTALPSAADIFAGAHGFTVQRQTTVERTHPQERALQFLERKRVVGAEMDSSDHSSLLRGKPDTHKRLRDCISDWVVDPERRWMILWILGTDDVGKYAVVQTIAKEFKASGHLGAFLSFSGLGHPYELDKITPTLAYQLASKHPEYKRMIFQRLTDNPTILERDHRTQFKELVTEPFQIIMERNAPTVKSPLLIILDGLDECGGEVAQCEFAELIRDFVKTVPNSPFLWIIRSRPAQHLVSLLSQPEFQATCRCEELSTDEIKIRQVDIQKLYHPPAPALQYLIGLLSGVLRTRQRQELLEGLRGKDAQLLINFLYLVLLRLGSVESEFQKHVFVMLYRLSKASMLYPQCYVLKDVSLDQAELANSGGFCDVYKIQYDGQHLCLRVLRIHQKDHSDRLLRGYSKETILWGQLEHPNILPFYGTCYLGPEPKRICLVSPWMENGNIIEYLKIHPSEPREHFVYDVACGLEYLHQQDIVHGDLKGANILVNDMGRVCIADFGLSGIQMDKAFTFGMATTAVAGFTTRWAAPEILDEGSNLTKLSDIWALGCVFYEILTGLLPFNECRNDSQIIRKIIGGGLPAQLDFPIRAPGQFDDFIRGLLRRCWMKDPHDRPTCQQIVQEHGAQARSGEGGSDITNQLAREKQRFRDAMRKDQDVPIDLARVEQVLNKPQQGT